MFCISEEGWYETELNIFKAHTQHPFTNFVHITDIASTLNQFDQVQSYEQKPEINKLTSNITPIS